MDNAEQSSLDDSMKDCLFYFEDAARSVAGGPELAVKKFKGHFASAWELRQELLVGASLLGWEGVSQRLQERIEKLVATASELPQAAFAGNDASELFHPSWVQVRDAANLFLSVKEAE